MLIIIPYDSWLGDALRVAHPPRFIRNLSSMLHAHCNIYHTYYYLSCSLLLRCRSLHYNRTCESLRIISRFDYASRSSSLYHRVLILIYPPTHQFAPTNSRPPTHRRPSAQRVATRISAGMRTCVVKNNRHVMQQIL
jgi:hypothetical protein